MIGTGGTDVLKVTWDFKENTSITKNCIKIIFFKRIMVPDDRELQLEISILKPNAKNKKAYAKVIGNYING